MTRIRKPNSALLGHSPQKNSFGKAPQRVVRNDKKKMMTKRPSNKARSEKGPTRVNGSNPGAVGKRKRKDGEAQEKKKKGKKPKHLKRKLENAADDLELHQQLMRQLSQFEGRKGKTEGFSKPVFPESQNHAEEQKKPTIDKSDGSVLLKNETAVHGDRHHQPTKETPLETPVPASTEKRAVMKTDRHADPATDEDSIASDVEESKTTKRERGRRRRGRKDTSKLIQEKQDTNNSPPKKTSSEEQLSKDDSGSTTMQPGEKASKGDPSKQRYCLGRKPVADFEVGKSYEGKVVYVKPFGVFFDIGCHSDAFCHVSRLADDFVEAPMEKFQVGDKVQALRVVEINRGQKRITVSLQQSQEKIAQEQSSAKAREERLRRRSSSSSSKSNNNGGGVNKTTTTTKRETNPELSFKHQARKLVDGTKQTTNTSSENHHYTTTTAAVKDMSSQSTSMMTPAELKRARKLERRAERRAKQQELEQSAE